MSGKHISIKILALHQVISSSIVNSFEVFLWHPYFRVWLNIFSPSLVPCISGFSKFIIARFGSVRFDWHLKWVGNRILILLLDVCLLNVGWRNIMHVRIVGFNKLRHHVILVYLILEFTTNPSKVWHWFTHRHIIYFIFVNLGSHSLVVFKTTRVWGLNILDRSVVQWPTSRHGFFNHVLDQIVLSRNGF